MFPKISTRTLRGAAALAVAVAVAVALPQGATTQQGATRVGTAPGSSETRLSRADHYRQRAERLYSVPARFRDVMELHLEAARFASVDDPGRVHDLMMAAVVAGRLGLWGQAESYLEEAATAALEFGDLPRAAQAYLLAASVEKELGHHKNADHLVLHALMLRNSGLMTEVDCECLDQRIAMLSGVKVPPR